MVSRDHPRSVHPCFVHRTNTCALNYRNVLGVQRYNARACNWSSVCGKRNYPPHPPLSLPPPPPPPPPHINIYSLVFPHYIYILMSRDLSNVNYVGSSVCGVRHTTTHYTHHTIHHTHTHMRMHAHTPHTHAHTTHTGTHTHTWL